MIQPCDGACRGSSRSGSVRIVGRWFVSCCHSLNLGASHERRMDYSASLRVSLRLALDQVEDDGWGKVCRSDEECWSFMLGILVFVWLPTGWCSLVFAVPHAYVATWRAMSLRCEELPMIDILEAAANTTTVPPRPDAPALRRSVSRLQPLGGLFGSSAAGVKRGAFHEPWRPSENVGWIFDQAEDDGWGGFGWARGSAAFAG